MKPEEILKELKSLPARHKWSARILQFGQIRLKRPGEKGFRRNPLCALACQLYGEVNLKWQVPGEALGLTDKQIQDFHLACDFRWRRSRLRMDILESCGLADTKFEEGMEVLASVFPKRKLESVLAGLSADDRDALESATLRRNYAQVREILNKNR